MQRDLLAQHANDCRDLAGQFASTQRDFLLQVAAEFERLAKAAEATTLEAPLDEGPAPGLSSGHN